MSDIEHRVLSTVERLTQRGSIGPFDRLFRDLHMDSLDYLVLLVEFDETFGATMPEEYVHPDLTIADIAKFYETRV